jgi:hypothetical protein
MNITKNDIINLAANRQTTKEYHEMTKDINIPDIPKQRPQTKRLNQSIRKQIETFLKSIDDTLLKKERLIFDDNIIGTYQHKFKKKNAREITFDIRHYTRDQFKELLEKLFLGLMMRINYSDSLYIEYYVKDENEPRYQILSSLNEGKLEEYIDTYLNNETEILESSYLFFDTIPADMESIIVFENAKYLKVKS